MAKKNTHIETLRGLAILLVVIGHVIGVDAKGGMQVADDSFFRYVFNWFGHLHMPLFTAIAGWVYALRPVQKGNMRPFLGKKVWRLLIPMIFVGTTYFLLQMLVPGTNTKGAWEKMWEIYVFPYTIYWYLPALFLVFAVIGYIDTQGWIRTPKQWLIAIGIGSLACFTELFHILPASVPNYFAFKSALYLFPFFLTGLGLNRFRELLDTPALQKIYLAGLLIEISLQQASFFYPESFAFHRDWHLSVFGGIFVSAYLINTSFRNRFLIWLAQYSYSIYLFHGFGTAGGRILLSRLGLQNPYAIFIPASVLALFGPVIAEKILIRWKFSRILFLGKK